MMSNDEIWVLVKKRASAKELDAIGSKHLEALNEKIESTEDKEETDEQLLKVGIEIEHEHQPTLDKIIADVTANGKVTMTIEQVAESIANDHIKEKGYTYYSDSVGLPAMERNLSKKKEAPGEEKYPKQEQAVALGFSPGFYTNPKN